jgi:hypothetical protein
VPSAAQQHQNTRTAKQSQIVRVKYPIGHPATDQEAKGGFTQQKSIVVAIRAKRPICLVAAGHSKRGKKNIGKAVQPDESK